MTLNAAGSVRKVVFCLYLAVWSFVFLVAGVSTTLDLGPEQPFRFGRLAEVALGVLVSSLGVMFTVGSFILWRERRSANLRGRLWVVAALLASVLISVALPLVFYGQWRAEASFWEFEKFFVIPQLFGAAGLLAFGARRNPVF